MRPSTSSTNKRIALLINNPFRDLPGMILTAWYLCQKGAICYLVPMNLRNEEIWALAPDFVLLNHFRTIYEDLVAKLMDAGIQVGVLDTEGSVFNIWPKSANSVLEGAENRGNDSAFEGYAFSMTRNKNLRHSISCFCAWTPEFAKYVIKRDWYRDNQITVTGSPRMDFFASQWQGVALKISDYAKDYKNHVIMINSSFALANSKFQSPEKELEMMIEKFSYNRDYMNQMMANQKNALNGLALLANQLAHHFPNVTFIFRPHPFENMETYKELLEPLPNLQLVKKGTIDGWLLRAKAIVHQNSSTAIEACLVGIPAFTAGWIPQFLPTPAVDSVSIECFSEQEIFTQIQDVLDGRFIFPSQISGAIDSIAEKTFYKIDGYAHQRVGDSILKSLQNGTNKVSIGKINKNIYAQKKKKGLRISFSDFKKFVKRLILISTNYNKISSENESLRKNRARSEKYFNWVHSEKYFDLERVQKIVFSIENNANQKVEQPINIVKAQSKKDYRLKITNGYSIKMYQSI